MSKEYLTYLARTSVYYVGKILTSNLTELTEFTCKICKRNLEYTKGELVAKVVFNQNYDYIISSYKYYGVIRKLILDFKFEDKRYLYKFLSSKLIILLKKYLENNNIDCIVYVPISIKRYYERGYNQSYILAQEISNKINVPLLKYGLIKIKNNKRQSELAHKERFNNIQNVYKANKLYDFCNKTILLVDDIYTTGNTVNECSRILKEKGANKVIVATVAIA